MEVVSAWNPSGHLLRVVTVWIPSGRAVNKAGTHLFQIRRSFSESMPLFSCSVGSIARSLISGGRITAPIEHNSLSGKPNGLSLNPRNLVSSPTHFFRFTSILFPCSSILISTHKLWTLERNHEKGFFSKQAKLR